MEVTNVEQVEQTTGAKKEWTAPELKTATIYGRTSGGLPGSIQTPTTSTS